jgi:SRSO17 transposase
VLGKQPNFQMLVSLTLTQKEVSGPIALRPYEPKIGRRTKRVVQEWR